jgi:predicted MFS family arabinose efflux permease
LALMTLFVAGNLACGLAPSFAVLLVARVAMSFSHAAFAGAGIALAISLVEERRQGSATAVMFGGPRSLSRSGFCSERSSVSISAGVQRSTRWR